MDQSGRPFPLRRDVETLRAQIEQKDTRRENSELPPNVDADVWARHLATIPWTQLSLGILGAFLGRHSAQESLLDAERRFRVAGDPFWLVCALLGRATRTELPPDIARESRLAVLGWLDGDNPEMSDRFEARVALRPDDASTLLYVICARESLPQELLGRAAQMVRSTNPHEDRRLSNLRAVATRRPADPQNASSLRNLIWGAIASGSGPFDNVAIDDPRVDPATVFDPITVAACVAVLGLGHSWHWLTEGPLREPLGETRRRPRGWPDELSLGLGEDVYRNYLDLLGQLHEGPDQYN
jgi:hypothetical protein